MAGVTFFWNMSSFFAFLTCILNQEQSLKVWRNSEHSLLRMTQILSKTLDPRLPYTGMEGRSSFKPGQIILKRIGHLSIAKSWHFWKGDLCPLIVYFGWTSRFSSFPMVHNNSMQLHSPPKETQHLVQELPWPQFEVNDPIGANNCEKG